MTLIIYELRKLARLPALWIFAALCLGLNLILILNQSYGLDFFNQTSQTASILGTHIDAAFIDELAAMPQSENRDTLLKAVTGVEDGFDDIDVDALSEYYQNMVKSSPAAAKWIQKKYELVKTVTQRLAQSDESLDLYAGPMTYESHSFLFGTLLRAVSAEGCIIGALAVLYLLGYEKLHRTELSLYTTRTGRRLRRCKALAGAIAAPALCALLAALSLGVYFCIWDYSGVLGSSVSSLFNYIQDPFIIKPFITWGSLTVGGYLAATLAVIIALTVVSALASAILGSLTGNSYISSLLPALACSLCLCVTTALSNLGMWAAFEVASFQPVMLWQTQNLWFTDSGYSTVLPWQEVITAVGWLIICSAGINLALKKFYRKDVT